MARNDDKSEEVRVIKQVVRIVIPIIILLIILFGTFYTIPAGNRGVVLTFGRPSELASIEGLHFKYPIVQKVVKMNVQTQRYDVAKAGAASKDLQTVTTDITVNYYISPDMVPEIYRKIGVNYQDKIITPAVQEVLKSATAQYTAEELITKRPLVKDEIDTKLRDRLAQYNIIVQSIAITDFQFSQIFNDAIENKVTAEQNALAAQNKLAQVQFEKQQRIAQAEGEAEAIKIQAQAITSQGGKDYVQLQAIGKWDGSLPYYMGGNAPIPFLNLGNSSI